MGKRLNNIKIGQALDLIVESYCILSDIEKSKVIEYIKAQEGNFGLIVFSHDRSSFKFAINTSSNILQVSHKSF